MRLINLSNIHLLSLSLWLALGMHKEIREIPSTQVVVHQQNTYTVMQFQDDRGMLRYVGGPEELGLHTSLQ